MENNYQVSLMKYAFSNRIPLFATIEIIGGCNFRCVHCYIDEGERNALLSFDEVKSIVDQLVLKGCLFITLTGGEVLLHPNFAEIYTYIAKKGIAVSVFTNGSQINQEVIDLFCKYPPKTVEITMYGFSEDIYKKVTKGAFFEKTKRAVLGLKKNNINVTLKMFILKENYLDIDNILQFAQENQIPFKSSALILAPMGANALDHQIDMQEMSKVEIKSLNVVPDYENYQLLNQYIRENTIGKLLQCGAGRMTCWIKSNYKLRLCNFYDKVEIDLHEYSFADAWEKLKYITDLQLPENSPCHSCELKNYCGICTAKSGILNDDLSMLSPSSMFCDIARCNYEKRKGAI